MENKNVKRECQIVMVSENGGDQIGPGDSSPKVYPSLGIEVRQANEARK